MDLQKKWMCFSIILNMFKSYSLGALNFFPELIGQFAEIWDNHLRRALQAELDQESTRTRAEAHFFKMQFEALVLPIKLLQSYSDSDIKKHHPG